MFCLFIFVVFSILAYGWFYEAFLKHPFNIKRLYFLNYISVYRFERLPRQSTIEECVRCGFLTEDDLYIDLTGGDDTCGVSDHMFFLLRMNQLCGNGEENRSATNLVTKKMRFRGRTEGELTGEWVYTVRGSFDPWKGWWNTKYRYAIENARGYTGDFYIDRGSGYRVCKELDMKLLKILGAVEKLREREYESKNEEVDMEFSKIKNQEKTNAPIGLIGERV